MTTNQLICPLTYIKVSSMAMAMTLAACGMSEPQGHASIAHAAPKAQSKSQSANAGWIIAAQKHNHSGISLRYKVSGQAVSGKPLSVELEFSGVSADDAQIQIRLDPALVPSATVGLQKSGDAFRLPLSKGQVSAQGLTITPQADGMHYIQMQMTQSGRTSAASIAIRVGETPVATPTLGEVQTTPSGEKIIVMPAGK
jgi:hypothetical protein